MQPQKNQFKEINDNKLGLSCVKLRASLNLSGFDEIIVYIDWFK